jgi:hypothetical protein
MQCHKKVNKLQLKIFINIYNYYKKLQYCIMIPEMLHTVLSCHLESSLNKSSMPNKILSGHLFHEIPNYEIHLCMLYFA